MSKIIELIVQVYEDKLTTLDLEMAVGSIVRCKDCKLSCDYTDIFPDRAYKCTKNGGYHNDDWFCADGKPKDS